MQLLMRRPNIAFEDKEIPTGIQSSEFTSATLDVVWNAAG
jgi:hypothetical protein